MSMQGWMKLFGAACILCGAAGCGIWFAGRYRQRILELEQLKQMVYLLKGQILYASAPLPEALETVGKRMDGALGTLFLETAASLESQPGEPFPVIWRKAVSVMEGKTALSKSDRQTLDLALVRICALAHTDHAVFLTADGTDLSLDGKTHSVSNFY